MSPAEKIAVALYEESAFPGTRPSLWSDVTAVDRAYLEETVQRLLDHGVILPGSTPWAIGDRVHSGFSGPATVEYVNRNGNVVVRADWGEGDRLSCVDQRKLRPLKEDGLAAEINNAKLAAQRVYEGRLDASGLPEIEHPAAVAAAVSREAQPAAWLHDVMEDGLLTESEVVEAGCRPVTLAALVYLTRDQPDPYTRYIAGIVNAPGQAGVIAREVKRADIHHNMTRPTTPEKRALRAPFGRYERAMAALGAVAVTVPL